MAIIGLDDHNSCGIRETMASNMWILNISKNCRILQQNKIHAQQWGANLLRIYPIRDDQMMMQLTSNQNHPLDAEWAQISKIVLKVKFDVENPPKKFIS